MPPLYFHLAVANEAAKRMQDPLININRSSYLLGSTLPDIHLITDGRRELTHFISLQQEPPYNSVKSFFQAHPELARNGNLDDSSKAAVAGYISHLVTDEVWIIDIYRPYFGPESPLEADPMANILDRAFQYELDRRERLSKAIKEELRPFVCQKFDVKVSFIDPVNLMHWRSFICRLTERVPSWEGFISYAERFLLPLNKVSREPLENFLRDFSNMREKVINMVPQEKLAEMKEKVVKLSVEEAREYLK